MTDIQTPSLADILGSFGEVEEMPLSRIQAATVRAMTRNWTTIPHVTHMDMLDVTELEAARNAHNRTAPSKLTPTPYLMKAVASVLVKLPQFNRSFDASTNTLVQRKYVHLGMAVDSPKGLVVPVIRDCDAKSVLQIAEEATALAEKARVKGLTLSEMSGGCFTVSALGPLGGTGFTPIINAPEVAILGISRMTETAARRADGEIDWRKSLPVALSYDHRAINGADAGRFMDALKQEIGALASNPAGSDTSDGPGII